MYSCLYNSAKILPDSHVDHDEARRAAEEPKAIRVQAKRVTFERKQQRLSREKRITDFSAHRRSEDPFDVIEIWMHFCTCISCLVWEPEELSIFIYCGSLCTETCFGLFISPRLDWAKWIYKDPGGGEGSLSSSSSSVFPQSAGNLTREGSLLSAPLSCLSV